MRLYSHLNYICVHHCHEVKDVYDLGKNVTDRLRNTTLYPQNDTN